MPVNSKSCVKPYHLSSDQARAGLSDNLAVTSKAIDNGKMDGFVTAQPNTAIGSLAMGYLNGSDLPYYWSLAGRFTLFDQFYAVVPGRGPAQPPGRRCPGQDAGLTSNAAPAAAGSPSRPSSTSWTRPT